MLEGMKDCCRKRRYMQLSRIQAFPESIVGAQLAMTRRLSALLSLAVKDTAASTFHGVAIVHVPVCTKLVA